MTRPLLGLYVMWHPSYSGGREIADRLRAHFAGDPYSAIDEWRDTSVLERSTAVPGSRTPLPIDWNDTELTAVVVLAEASLVDDPDWVGYVQDTARAARDKGLSAAFIPVTMESEGLALEPQEQALRWDRWEGPRPDRIRRLTSDLTHALCLMLRHRLDVPGGAGGEDEAFGRYLQKIQVFISHTKRDRDGESVAHAVRDWIHAHSPLGSFFDVHDIPAGLPFGNVLLHQIGAGAVLAVHTDSYSSREWCRREVIEAKRRLVPMVVLDCVRDTVPRGMVYLGNVPIVRMDPDDPDRTDRIGTVVSCLLDEVFRTWLWLCRVEHHSTESAGAVFTARPPELIALAARPSADAASVSAIVYPEPLLSADEERLFRKIAPGVRVQTLTNWLEERS